MFRWRSPSRMSRLPSQQNNAVTVSTHPTASFVAGCGGEMLLPQPRGHAGNSKFLARAHARLRTGQNDKLTCRNLTVGRPSRLVRDHEVVTAYREGSLAARG
jgi:hypothetical protein